MSDVPRDGRYRWTLEDELRDYVRDEWDEITATETPIALQQERKAQVAIKRSGTYIKRDLEALAEVVQLQRKCLK